MSSKIQPGDALLIVDVQYDFLPGGALGIADADQIIPIINQWITAAKEAGVPIIASRDWHPANHCSFEAQGGPWPAHCVKHTHGAALHEELNLPDDVIIFSKASMPDKENYSAFEGKSDNDQSLAEKLHALNVKRIWVCGLALDYCVYYSGLDADKHGFLYHVILPATKAITEDTKQKALADLIVHHAVLEENANP